jgi:hypothetical protein
LTAYARGVKPLAALLVLGAIPTVTPVAHADAVVADLGLHVIGAGVHHALTPRQVLAVDLDFYGPWTTEQHQGLTTSALMGAVVRVRPFLFRDAGATGWWLSPFAQLGVGWGAYPDGRHAGAVWAVGAAIGHAWQLGPLTLLVGLGAQYHHADVGAGPPSFAGLWPHADAIVGWTF